MRVWRKAECRLALTKVDGSEKSTDETLQCDEENKKEGKLQ